MHGGALQPWWHADLRLCGCRALATEEVMSRHAIARLNTHTYIHTKYTQSTHTEHTARVPNGTACDRQPVPRCVLRSRCPAHSRPRRRGDPAAAGALDWCLGAGCQPLRRGGWKSAALALRSRVMGHCNRAAPEGQSEQRHWAEVQRRQAEAQVRRSQTAEGSQGSRAVRSEECAGGANEEGVRHRPLTLELLPPPPPPHLKG